VVAISTEKKAEWVRAPHSPGWKNKKGSPVTPDGLTACVPPIEGGRWLGCLLGCDAQGLSQDFVGQTVIGNYAWGGRMDSPGIIERGKIRGVWFGWLKVGGQLQLKQKRGCCHGTAKGGRMRSARQRLLMARWPGGQMTRWPCGPWIGG